MLGQAIRTWVQYDEVTTLLIFSSSWAAQTGVLLTNSLFQIRGPRQPEPTDFLETQHNNQSHCSYVQEHNPGDESRASRPPDVTTTNVGLHRVCLAVIGRLNGLLYSQEGYLKHCPQASRFAYTPPGETLFADPPNSPCTHAAPTSQTYSHPDSATSPCGMSSQYRPWSIPKARDLWEAIQPQGEDDYWSEASLPLAASRPLEGPLYPSPNHSPTQGTDADSPPWGPSFGSCAV